MNKLINILLIGAETQRSFLHIGFQLNLHLKAKNLIGYAPFN